MSRQRLQKVLARAGVASRRGAERLIAAGRVRVDGAVVTELGTAADPDSQCVEVDGRQISLEPTVCVVLNKPRGVVCTMQDPQGRPTVARFVADLPARVVPVGRLDFQTSGVLLMTNDGELARRLLHPSQGVSKLYELKVRGVVGEAGLDRLRRSIVIDGRPTRPARVTRLRVEGDKTWLRVELHEGRNRQVRRLAEQAGYAVMRLSRVSFGGVTAEGLPPGAYRKLSPREVSRLGGGASQTAAPGELSAPGRAGGERRPRKRPRDRR